MDNECCANCALCMVLKKQDYTKGGCTETDMDGYACLVFKDEGIICWMLGVDKGVGMCEMYTPKAVKWNADDKGN